jgi:hypothetical protein
MLNQLMTKHSSLIAGVVALCAGIGTWVAAMAFLDYVLNNFHLRKYDWASIPLAVGFFGPLSFGIGVGLYRGICRRLDELAHLSRCAIIPNVWTGVDYCGLGWLAVEWGSHASRQI